MLKIMLHGCKGRMGLVLEQMIATNSEMQVVCGIDAKADGTENYPVFKNINDCDIKCDVAIDFSNHKAIPALIEYCVEHNLPVVVATTSLSEETEKMMDEAAKTIPVFSSFNMSLGINVMADILTRITPLLENDCDIEIIEKHHNKKKDSPSGTAMLLANAVNEGSSNSREYTFGRHGTEYSRNRNEIGIHAVRCGSIPGEHTVIFAGDEEILEIKHTALSRNIFAKGALQAAQFTVAKTPGRYTMKELVASDGTEN